MKNLLKLTALMLLLLMAITACASSNSPDEDTTTAQTTEEITTEAATTEQATTEEIITEEEYQQKRAEIINNLIVNIIFAFAEFKKHPLLAIGLLLFALCDVIIGFYFIDDYLPLAADSIIYKILGSGINLAWIFYLPAQTLLSISLLPKRLKSK